MNVKPSKTTLLASCLLCLTLLAGNSPIAHADDQADLAAFQQTGKAIAAIVKKASPAVVHVAVEKDRKGPEMDGDPTDLFNDPFFRHFFGPQFQHPRTQPRGKQRTFKQQAAGSGFIIESDGYILTNNHVVKDVDKITVRLADKREFPAKVIGTDPQSDVALIKIEAKGLPVLPLGNSDALEVGEWAIAIGSPFELNQTVTVGVVSAKGRNRVGITNYENFIQTDAAINPGNSGGPLLNAKGEAVGINTAIFSRSGGYMGIGFAIPINMAKNIEQQLRKNGKVVRGWLGVMIQDVNEDLAKSFGGQVGGALITQVSDNSPAKKNGLLQGDIITSINGEKVENVGDLRNRIAMTPPNTELKMQVLRDGKIKDLVVTVGEQPKDMASSFGDMKGSAGQSSDLGKFGLTLQNLTKELAEQFGYTPDQGVLITEVSPDSGAAELGLKSGMLIEEVNRVRVHNTSELTAALKKSGEGKSILLRVRDGENSQYVVLQKNK